jgi:hypothetical protein
MDLPKHKVCSHNTAMHVLEYICHGPAAHKPNIKDDKVIVNNQFLDLPSGTVIGRASMKLFPTVSWSTYLLYEMYLQIKFIPEERGFLNLQHYGFH